MKIMVVATSKHGSTQEIAEAIGAELRHAGRLAVAGRYYLQSGPNPAGSRSDLPDCHRLVALTPD
jgi:flavorubredoxin